MIRGLNLAAQSLGIEVDNDDKPKGGQAEFTEDDIPMMYRSQVEGRCSLQFAGTNKDLDKWTDEWVYPKDPERNAKTEKNKKKSDTNNIDSNVPRYQMKMPLLGLEGNIYRIEVDFPFRLISNCGQDSVIRPIMGKNGIPSISGSSVKGLFRRACSLDQIKKYCGVEDVKDKGHCPSTLGLRFHGAYPIGDWSGSHMVKVEEKGQEVPKVRYRMLDVVHPQQDRQVGTGKKQNATALTSISLYKPTMIFEFSGNALTEVDWKEVESIFWKAIALGVGGKTSTGYGLGSYNNSHPATIAKHKFDLALIGQGVSPTLRSDEPEFRPNLFKASLRGHVKRLLGGVTRDNRVIDQEVDRLFGSSTDVGALKIFWEKRKDVDYDDYGKTKTFTSEGILHLDAKDQRDVDFMEQVLKFAFVMGGFGKSWRRASHKKFHATYKKFEIGCHWQLATTDLKWIDIKSRNSLKQFLENLHQQCKQKYSPNQLGCQDWREAWHPDRVTVFAKETIKSLAIEIFHDPIFNTTPAIGGRNPDDKRPKFVSHVWHRMLPIDNDGNYLEIITVFHYMQRKEWIHENHGNQLQPFIDKLEAMGLEYLWGKENPPHPLPHSTKPNLRPKQ